VVHTGGVYFICSFFLLGSRFQFDQDAGYYDKYSQFSSVLPESSWMESQHCVMVEFLLMHSLAGHLKYVADCSGCWKVKESNSKANSGIVG
jgi:hypothetical protein